MASDAKFPQLADLACNANVQFGRDLVVPSTICVLVVQGERSQYWKAFMRITGSERNIQVFKNHGVMPVTITHCVQDLRPFWDLFAGAPPETDPHAEPFDLRLEDGTLLGKLRQTLEARRHALLLWLHAQQEVDLTMIAQEVYGCMTPETLGKRLLLLPACDLPKQGDRAVGRGEEADIPFQNDKLPYLLDPESIEEHFPFAVDGRTGLDGAQRYLEEYLGIHALWEKLCRMLDIRKKPSSLQLAACAEGATAVRDVFETLYGFEDGEPVLSGVRAAPHHRILYPFRTLIDNTNNAHSSAIIALLFKLTGNVPINNFIIAGLAEAGARLFAEHYDEPLWDICGADPSKVRTLLGPEGRFAIADGADTSSMPELLAAGGWAYAGLFRHLLGKTHQKRVQNFQRLLTLCMPMEEFQATVSMTGDESEFGFRAKDCPTHQKWLDQCDALIPGFKDGYCSHPITLPVAVGSRVLWFPVYHAAGTLKDPWGVLTAFDFQPNPLCGRISGGRPWPNMADAPQFRDFDTNLGASQPLPLTIRISVQGFEPFEYEAQGRIDINPRLIDSMAGAEQMDEVTFREWKAAMYKDFSIEVLVPVKEEWVTLGEHFSLDLQDRQNVRDSHNADTAVECLEHPEDDDGGGVNGEAEPL